MSSSTASLVPAGSGMSLARMGAGLQTLDGDGDRLREAAPASTGSVQDVLQQVPPGASSPSVCT